MSTPKRPRRSTASSQASQRKTMKLNQSFSDRMKARKLTRQTRKAEYLATLPKERLKRLLYRLHPKRVAKYWFSREGAIMALKITGVGIVALFLIIVGLFAYFRKDLPKIKDLNSDKVGGSITYYDRSGKTVLWQDYGAVKRVAVPGDEISPYMKQATIAIEDKDFYKHGAFDLRGIIRAGLHDAIGGGGQQGGSTITQQLVKNDQGWTYDHSYSRKAKEIILAVELEREYSKDDILTGYLNVAPYGSVDRGAEAAARDYFGVSAKDLSLAQAAMLASIPKAPTAYSPYSDPKYNPGVTENDFNAPALIGRQQYVLQKMVDQHMITQKQANDAKKVDVLAQIHTLAPSKYDGIKAPYFVLAAKSELQQRFGAAAVERGGWKVITTLNLDLQNLAEQQVSKGMAAVRARGGDDAAFAAEDVKTGQMVALVGGVDFTNPTYGKLNFGHDVKVSPGSSFKPYDAVTLINNNNNVGAGSVLYDAQGALPGWPCQDKTRPTKTGDNSKKCLWDYDFNYPGPITLRYALGGSRNVPWVKAMLSSDPSDKCNTGDVVNCSHTQSINKTISTADALMGNTHGYVCYPPGTDVFSAGSQDESQCYGSAAIGDGAYIHLDDHVNGLASLARLGNVLPRTYILRITDAGNKVVSQWTPPKGKQVVKQDAAYIVDDMASDPNASYLGGSCTDTSCSSPNNGKYHRYKGWHFAIKTGTTNDGFDGLMASWSTQYATVTWVGSHTRTVTMRPYMEDMTGPIERGWMQTAHDMLNTKPVNWQAPSDIKTLPAFIVRNHVGLGSREPSPTNDIFPSWYVGGNKSSASTSQTLDKVSGKVATSCTPALAKDVQSNANVFSWNVDIFNNGKPNVSSATTSTTNSSKPAATDDVHNCNDPPPLVSVSVAGDTCGPGACTITVTASQQSGGHPLSGGSYTTAPAGTITVQLGGQNICSIAIPDTANDVYSDSSCSYTPTSAQTATLTATVTDSVLYQGTGTSDPINFTVATTPVVQQLKLNPVTYVGGIAQISWSGGTGPYTVYKTAGHTAIATCTNVVTGTSCAASLPHNTPITVEDSSSPKLTDSGTTP